MYFSAGTSGLVHTVVVAVSLFSIPAIELAFGDRFGQGQTHDVLTYGESSDFQSNFSSGALTRASEDETADSTESGIDPDSNSNTNSSGEFGFDEVGDADKKDSRFGSPDEEVASDDPAGGAGRGTDKALEAASTGDTDDPGDSGEAEEPGEATREIVVFVNLRPEPRPDEEPIEADPARAKGNTDIPAAVASIGTGEIPTEVAALVSDDTTTIGGIPQSGDPEGLADGETDEGRKSETEANQAASPTIGDFSLPDTASELPTDTPGSSPESFPIADTASLAEIATTTAENPSDDLSGTASELNSATVAEQATGQPGLPNQDATPDEKTPVEGEPRPELAVTTPTEVFERLETPALRNEQAQKLVDPDDPGLSTIVISGRASGVEEAIQGAPGPDNEDSQDEIRIAEGNPDAERTAAKGEEVRDGVLENGVESTEGNDDTGLISTQLASLQESDEFRAPDKGPRDQPAIATGELTPLAKIIAAIAGKNEALARALTNPKPLDTVGGIPDPGDLKTNDVLEKAADAGLAQAQTKLAQRYIIGLAIGATPDKVAELLRNAAERGDQEAQLLLGALFADGRIVPKDLVQSHVFFELASAQGNDEANEMLPVLERQMTPREVVDSRRLARQYKRLLDSIAAARTLGSRGDGLRDQLLQASAAGNTAKIAELLSRGADLEGDDTAGRTAVINAAWRGEQEVVDLLVELDADLNVADHDGRTAVSWAASNGHADIVRKLLLSGARPAIDDKEGLTPLMRAAWNGHEDVVRLLVDAGSTLSATDDVGKSPGFCGRLECKPLPQFDLMRE